MVTEITGTTESPLLTPRPRAGGLDRDDVVVRKGQFTLLNGHLTPQQSMIEDLLFIRRVLDEAEVPFLLVRGNDVRPVIAVDTVHRAAFTQAMAAASAAEHATVEANDIMMVRGEPQLVVRFTGTDDDFALGVGAAVESTVRGLAEVRGARVTRRDGGAWTLVGAV